LFLDFLKLSFGTAFLLPVRPQFVLQGIDLLPELLQLGRFLRRVLGAMAAERQQQSRQA